MPRTVSQVINSLPLAPSSKVDRLPAPPYFDNNPSYSRAALAVHSMQRHMSDEGWQLMQALEKAGYSLHGSRLSNPSTNVRQILDTVRPGTVLVQDKREWDPTNNRLAKPEEEFKEIHALREHLGIFKVTVLKDSHQRPPYHAESAKEMGCNGWVIYYHPRIVQHLARYIRPWHCVRTYHSIDPALIPAYSSQGRKGCLLSGAVNSVYPLRHRLVDRIDQLQETEWLQHPGYHNYKTCTPEFLRTLSRFKVAICTSSMYGYALRKIIEATACGCMVITDLPSDDMLPMIDENLIRLESNTVIDQVAEVTEMLPVLYAKYDHYRQEYFAQTAINWYNYTSIGQRLANDIEHLRLNYNSGTSATL